MDETVQLCCECFEVKFDMIVVSFVSEHFFFQSTEPKQHNYMLFAMKFVDQLTVTAVIQR